MVVPVCLLVCDRVVLSSWWCGFLLVGIWRILLHTVRSRCSSRATSSVETSGRLCCLSLDVLQLVNRGSVIQSLVLALVPRVLLVSILSRILLAAFSLLGYRTSVPFLIVVCFVLAEPFP